MIRTNRTYDGQITILRIKGRLTFSGICSQMIGFSHKDHFSHVLCDFTNATAADLTTREIENVFKRIGQYVSTTGDVKAAVVAHGRVDFGLAQMFSTFSEIAGLPVKVKTFRSTEVAKKWLSADQ